MPARLPDLERGRRSGATKGAHHAEKQIAGTGWAIIDSRSLRLFDTDMPFAPIDFYKKGEENSSPWRGCMAYPAMSKYSEG
jgi:hypothetical protein